MGRTLDDGHRHEVDWSPAGLDRIVDVVTSAAGAAGRHPQLEALVQHVEITDDAAAAAGRLAELVPGASVDDLLGSPFTWIGTVEEIRTRLDAHHSDLGIDRYVVRAPAVKDVRQILGDALSGQRRR